MIWDGHHVQQTLGLALCAICSLCPRLALRAVCSAGTSSSLCAMCSVCQIGPAYCVLCTGWGQCMLPVACGSSLRSTGSTANQMIELCESDPACRLYLWYPMKCGTLRSKSAGVKMITIQVSHILTECPNHGAIENRWLSCSLFFKGRSSVPPNRAQEKNYILKIFIRWKTFSLLALTIVSFGKEQSVGRDDTSEVKAQDSVPGNFSQLCHWLFIWHWEVHLQTLYCSFLICKMRIMIHSYLKLMSQGLIY